MKRRAYLLEQLTEAQSETRLVTVSPKFDPDKICGGYVVGLSAEFVLLHQYSVGVICFNGWVAIPLGGINKVRLPHDHDNAIHRALQIKGMTPTAPQSVDLTDFVSLLSSVDAHFPLTALHVDDAFNQACHIGRVAKLGERAVTLRKIDAGANWIDIEKFRYDTITRIDFGGGYEEALWLVAQDARKQKEAPTSHD